MAEQGEGNDGGRTGEGSPARKEPQHQPSTSENRAPVAPERTDEYSGLGDWGRQGAWGTFGNRADWRHDRDWENSGGDWGGEPAPGDPAASPPTPTPASESDKR
jgi:hypothetical protein